MVALRENTADVVSNISKCSTYYIPTVEEYLQATDIYGIALICIGALASVISIILYVDTLITVIHSASSKEKGCTAFILSVYPVTCLVSYFAIIVPRSHLLCEALTQGMFMTGMYQLFCLFVSYCGGDAQLVKQVKPNELSMKVGPCCCWPCCSLLPTLKMEKKIVKCLKLLVLQLPVVQGLVYFIILVMWAEAESLYEINYLYLQPIIIISIIFGIWGMLMTINLLKTTLDSSFLLFHKFIVLQMVLVLAKIQGIIARMLVWYDVFPCKPPVTPQVYANLIHNTLMIMEMVILGCIARNLYKRKVPEICKKSINGVINTVFSGSLPHVNNNNNEHKESM
ncbi:organic solute transporter alpha-like protein isoform X2 [Anthonomus grandis grandis]|uniref:organic solute transporter alpha-like protein isoform X2 n=1 Tax=Anthonomus grandis grandis TaxID=2921223 RepID=UPI002165C6C8|nr:organic solute transporter alpha-like protein isoform X2 [Anthonomus grandis grandis]